jgi:hypothetical protein
MEDAFKNWMAEVVDYGLFSEAEVKALAWRIE